MSHSPTHDIPQYHPPQLWVRAHRSAATPTPPKPSHPPFLIPPKRPTVVVLCYVLRTHTEQTLVQIQAQRETKTARPTPGGGMRSAAGAELC